MIVRWYLQSKQHRSEENLRGVEFEVTPCGSCSNVLEAVENRLRDRYTAFALVLHVLIVDSTALFY